MATWRGGLRKRAGLLIDRPRAVVEAQLGIRAARRAPSDLGEAFDVVCSFKCGRLELRPWQVKSELLQLLTLVSDLQPRTVLELGTGKGGSLFLLSRVADPAAHIVTVDLEGSAFGGGYRESYGRFLRSVGQRTQDIALVRGDSHSAHVQTHVSHLTQSSVDFLLIDGDHRYDGVAADFATYGALVRAGGVIAFHDIVDGPDYAVGGVPRFWRELRASAALETDEIVESWEQGGYGIGLVRVSASDSA